MVDMRALKGLREYTYVVLAWVDPLRNREVVRVVIRELEVCVARMRIRIELFER